MTAPESDGFPQIAGSALNWRARAFLGQFEGLPRFDGKHEKVDPRTAGLQHLLRDFQQRAAEIETDLDPDREHALRETVLAYPSQPGDDMFAVEYDHLTLHAEPAVDLWPLYLPEEDQSRYTHFFLDARGRLFGTGSERLVEAMNPDRRFIPIEVPMASIDIRDALAAHQAMLDFWDTLRIIRKLS